jgi:hypothetical protein
VPAGAPAQETTEDRIPASVRLELREDALSAASESGDPHPSDIEAVQTTSGKAQAVRGVTEPNAPANTPVYLIAMRGEFHDNGPGEPAEPGGTVEAKAPSTVMTLEIPAESRKDATIARRWTDIYPDLASLGTPVEL